MQVFLLKVKKRIRDKIDIDFFKIEADSKAISKQERQPNLYLKIFEFIFEQVYFLSIYKCILTIYRERNQDLNVLRREHSSKNSVVA